MEKDKLRYDLQEGILESEREKVKLEEAKQNAGEMF
jgi:hypothetical protein